jgi:hypothetical protein
VVAHTYNPRTQETEAGGFPVLGQPGLHYKTLPQKGGQEWLSPVIPNTEEVKIGKIEV